MSEHVSGTFEIRRGVDGQRVVLTLVGELDVRAAPELEAQLSELDGETPVDYLIDLSGLTFVDSSGLAVIIGATRAADANGHTLTFRRGSPRVHRLLDLTRTTDQLTFED